MSDPLKCIQKIIENRLTDLHTAMPCKVESFNESAATAKVIPLYKIKFSGDVVATERPPLDHVPVLKQRFRLPTESGTSLTTLPLILEPGDIVLVAFLERAFDMVRNGSIADPVYNRKHALDDPIIIGII